MRVDMGLPADRMLAAGSRLPSVGADPSQTAVCTLTTVPAGHKCGGEGERVFHGSFHTFLLFSSSENLVLGNGSANHKWSVLLQ